MWAVDVWHPVYCDRRVFVYDNWEEAHAKLVALGLFQSYRVGDVMQLPVDVVPGTNPPKFRWRQCVSNPYGSDRWVEYEAVLPPNVEDAVLAMVELVKKLQQEVDQLRRVHEGLTERMAAQSELLSKRAETSPQQVSTLKKTKGVGG